MFYAMNVTTGEVIGFTTENTRFANLSVNDPRMCPISDTCAYEIMTMWLEANGHGVYESRIELEADYYALYRYYLLIDTMSDVLSDVTTV